MPLLGTHRITRFHNVIVFGDSLSDIGLKVQTFMGKFAKGIGEMTTNPTGRFSDCRNWTDHMYESATGGRRLVLGSVTETKQASRKHQALTTQAFIDLGHQAAPPARTGTPPPPTSLSFYYANYAMGGDCGGIPADATLRGALGTFKDQVRRFKADWKSFHGPAQKTGAAELKTLFLVWFGANDLYTAGADAGQMAGVAIKMAKQRRAELADIVGAENAHFVFCNLPGPRASVRYPNWVAKGKSRGLLKRGKWTDEKVDQLGLVAGCFNKTLRDEVLKNGDGLVDIATAVGGKDEVAMMLSKLGMTGLERQEKGTSDTFVPPKAYNAWNKSALWSVRKDLPVLDPDEQNTLKSHTSDKVHPTDPVYKYMWGQIHKVISARSYTFGVLPPG
jgi:phospholipase/lecithinase/hemolysin